MSRSWSLAVLVPALLLTGCMVRTSPPPRREPPPPRAQPGVVVAQGDTGAPAPEPTSPPTSTTQPTTVPPGALHGPVSLKISCTRMACTNNACCNKCNLEVWMTPSTGQWAGTPISLGGHGCRVDGCGQVSKCALQDGAVVTFPDVRVRCSGNNCMGTISR